MLAEEQPQTIGYCPECNCPLIRYIGIVRRTSDDSHCDCIQGEQDDIFKQFELTDD